MTCWPNFSYEGDAAFFDVFGIELFKERFNKTETAGKYELFDNYFTVDNREQTMKDFARLNVYIADSNVVKTQETEDYPTNQLVSDIGKWNSCVHPCISWSSPTWMEFIALVQETPIM